jgi:hypothetical protein
MAISVDWQKTISGFSGVLTSPSCYCKVTTVTCDKLQGEAQVLMLSASPETGGLLLDSISRVFPLDLDGPNPNKQAYEHLKTLPEFSDAVDC